MDVVLERCAGIDVGKDEVVACVRTPGSGRRGRRKETRTFRSFLGDLESMAEWFTGEGVTEVAMEATGSYWKPVWHVLEDRGFDLKLVNAHHVKILPGRKSDVLDAEWIAELLEHGLLRGSFVPPPVIRELRDLTRYRKRLVQTHTQEAQRVQKTLEDAGIKLDSVASDVLGVSGRAMLRALIAGERDPEVLAEMAKGTLRKKIPDLQQALRGRFSQHHGLLIAMSLDHIDHLEATMARLDAQIDAMFAANVNEAGVPFQRARDHLDTIPGVAKRAAEAILAKSTELTAARGIDSVRLGIVVANWEHTWDLDGEPFTERFSAPVLLRSVALRRVAFPIVVADVLAPGRGVRPVVGPDVVALGRAFPGVVARVVALVPVALRSAVAACSSGEGLLAMRGRVGRRAASVVVAALSPSSPLSLQAPSSPTQRPRERRIR